MTPTIRLKATAWAADVADCVVVDGPRGLGRRPVIGRAGRLGGSGARRRAAQVAQAGRPAGRPAVIAAGSPDERGRRAATGIQQRADGAGQLRLVEIAHDPRPLHEADLAVLLGDDDHDRVRLLGDPQRGPVAGPEAFRVDRRIGQRQRGAGRHDRSRHG